LCQLSGRCRSNIIYVTMPIYIISWLLLFAAAFTDLCTLVVRIRTLVTVFTVPINIGHRSTVMEWRKLHNEELNYLCSSPNIFQVTKSRRMRWAEHVARMGERRGVNRVLVRKPDRERPLGRPKT